MITWDLTEPSGGIFDYAWVPTVNRFQAVLRRDGSIDLSYDQLRAQDAIVGVYPVIPLAREQSLASLPDAADSAVPAHLDLRSVKASVVDGRFLRITIETRSPVLRPGDPNLAGVSYQIYFDGTFSQLDDNFYVPATGWSPLELYLMGLATASEVPDFFLLRNLKPVGKDDRGYPTFKADRVKITIKDVIATLGPRQPDFEHSQKIFNTGIVALVLHDASPSRELVDRLNAIREAYIEFWATTTGHRSVMNVSVK